MLLKIQYRLAATLYYLFNSLLWLVEKLLFRWKNVNDPKIILIYRTGYLGDTFSAIPAFLEIERRYLNAYRILLTNQKRSYAPTVFEVLSDIIQFNEILPYDPSKIYQIQYSFHLLSTLRKKKIDHLIYFGASNATIFRVLRDMLFFKLAGCRSASGFRIHLHRHFRIAQRMYHQFNQDALRLLKIVDSTASESKIAWNLPETFYPLEIDQKLPVIAVHPSANVPVKKWPLERYREACRRLQNQYSAQLIFIGGADAEKDAHEVALGLPGKTINLTGKTGFLETAAILRQCDFLLSNDSGPVHIAAAVGTPVVGIYSAREFPNIWYPWGENHAVFRKDVKCQICDLKECPIMICINHISVEEVFSACDRILKNNGYASTL